MSHYDAVPDRRGDKAAKGEAGLDAKLLLRRKVLGGETLRKKGPERTTLVVLLQRDVKRQQTQQNVPNTAADEETKIEKISVIFQTDTVPNPRTVVIHGF